MCVPWLARRSRVPEAGKVIIKDLYVVVSRSGCLERQAVSIAERSNGVPLYQHVTRTSPTVKVPRPIGVIALWSGSRRVVNPIIGDRHLGSGGIEHDGISKAPEIAMINGHGATRGYVDAVLISVISVDSIHIGCLSCSILPGACRRPN